MPYDNELYMCFKTMEEEFITIFERHSEPERATSGPDHIWPVPEIFLMDVY